VGFLSANISVMAIYHFIEISKVMLTWLWLSQVIEKPGMTFQIIRASTRVNARCEEAALVLATPHGAFYCRPVSSLDLFDT